MSAPASWPWEKRSALRSETLTVVMSRKTIQKENPGCANTRPANAIIMKCANPGTPPDLVEIIDIFSFKDYVKWEEPQVGGC